MRSKLLVLCGCFLLASACIAQTHETSIEYDKKKQKALVAEFAYSIQAVENAIIQRLEKLGYKGREEKGMFNKDRGFRVYKNAQVNEITPHSMDYVILVETKSKKEKDVACLYLLIKNKEGQNVIEAGNPEVVDNAKSFMDKLSPHVEAANLELTIIAQAEIITKAEKKLKYLQEDKTEMEKKIQKLQEDIKQNEKDQEDTQNDIEKQKLNLENLKGKRKNIV